MALHSVQGSGGDYVSIEAAGGLAPTTDFVGRHWTLAGWLRLIDTPSNNSYLLSYGNYGVANSFNIYWQSGGTLNLRAEDGDGTNLIMEGSPDFWGSGAVAGPWLHIAVVRDGDTFTGYRNGVQVSQTTQTNFNDIERTDALFFGTRADDASGRRNDVDFAHWAVWDRSLTAQEIRMQGGGQSPLWLPNKRRWYAPMRTFGRDYDNRLDIPRNGVATVVADPPGIVHPSRPVIGFVAAAPGAGRIMASLANHGGLAGHGGIAGQGGGLAA